MPKTFLRKRQVAARYGDICTTTVDRWVARGRLPAPTWRGRVQLWDTDELDEFDRVAPTVRAVGKSTAPADPKSGATAA